MIGSKWILDTEQELDLGGPVPLKSNPMFDH